MGGTCVMVTNTDTNFGHKQNQCGHESPQNCNSCLRKGKRAQELDNFQQGDLPVTQSILVYSGFLPVLVAMHGEGVPYRLEMGPEQKIITVDKNPWD